MKKMLTVLLTVLMALTLSACGKTAEKGPDTQETPTPAKCHVETLFSRNGFRVTSEEVTSLNCTVLLPASWAGKWDLCVNPSGITVYCTEARDAFTRWDDTGGPVDENLLMGRRGGMLFYMEWRQGDYTSYVPGLLKVLRKNETVLVEMDHARDVQYTDETAELYQVMAAEVDQIQFLFDN